MRKAGPKGEPDTGTNHVGFRLVKSVAPPLDQGVRLNYSIARRYGSKEP